MSNRKRIAILADFPWSFFADGATGRGGGQACTWLSQLAAEFADLSPYEIHWVSIDRDLTWGPVMRQAWGGQQFSKIPGGRLKIDLSLGYGLSRYLLRRELKRIRPSLIHCWGTERSYSIMCGTAGLPAILSMQGVLSNLRKKGYLPDTWVWRRIPALEQAFIEKATVVTCESQWAADRVLEVVPDADVRQVEYGVHPSFYDLEWQPDENQPYAVFIGTLTGYKGVNTLLDALRNLEDRSWTFKFVGGDGPLLDEVRNCGIPRVEFLGNLPWTRLQQVLRKASCLVHPTLADSSPNVVKEARVVGLPVITTPHGGQAGYIRDGENGIIVERLEPIELARALSRLMDDPQLARRMGAARHAADRAYFRPAETAQGFLRIYEELVSR